MKKLIFFMTILLVLSVNFVVRADGDGHLPGGFYCPPDTVCPSPSPCPPLENCEGGDSSAATPSDDETEEDIFDDILSMLGF